MTRRTRTEAEKTERRERDLSRMIRRQEAEWNAKIAAKMATGMSFDEAFVACGGTIIEDISR